MRNTVAAAALTAALVLSAACRHADAELSFTVRSATVTEGEDLPVMLSVHSGPREGYSMTASVDAFDTVTGEASPTGKPLFDGDAPAPAQGVSFPDSGHHDFRVPGLAPGTYRISVTLTRGTLSATASCVSIVRAGDGSGGTGAAKVTSLSVPGASDGFTVETEGGFPYIVLDLRTEAGRETDYRVRVSPADAGDTSVSADSDNPAAVTVRVTGGSLLHIAPKAVGKAVVTVRSNDGGASASFGVRVVDTTPAPGTGTVTDFTVPEPDPAYRKVTVACGENLVFTPAVTPSGAAATFTATSSDPEVAAVSASGGTVTVRGVYPGYASITVTAEGGPSRTFPVMVWKAVTVTADWYELEASDAQLKRKCFPCKLRFRSDSDVDFPSPVTWTVSMKAVVTVAGRDTRSVSHREDVRFWGKNPAYYDVTNNILIPAWEFYQTTDFGLAVSLSLQRNEALDPDIWRITWKDDYKDQEARITPFLTEIQQ